jgi:hypothetical protein
MIESPDQLLFDSHFSIIDKGHAGIIDIPQVGHSKICIKSK